MSGFENKLPALVTLRPLAPSETVVLGGGCAAFNADDTTAATLCNAVKDVPFGDPPVPGVLNVVVPAVFVRAAKPAAAAADGAQSPYVQLGSAQSMGFSFWSRQPVAATVADVAPQSPYVQLGSPQSTVF